MRSRDCGVAEQLGGEHETMALGDRLVRSWGRPGDGDH